MLVTNPFTGIQWLIFSTGKTPSSMWIHWDLVLMLGMHVLLTSSRTWARVTSPQWTRKRLLIWSPKKLIFQWSGTWATPWAKSRKTSTARTSETAPSSRRWCNACASDLIGINLNQSEFHSLNSGFRLYCFLRASNSAIYFSISFKGATGWFKIVLSSLILYASLFWNRSIRTVRKWAVCSETFFAPGSLLV